MGAEKRNKELALKAVHFEFCRLLDKAELVLKRFGISHWKLSLIARNSDRAKAGEWVNVSNDQPSAVAQMLLQPGLNNGDEMPPFMEELGPVERTPRGFPIIRFKDFYGTECSLQMSSLALCAEPGQSAVWLGVSGLDSRMHLTVEQVIALMACLRTWLDKGVFKEEKLEPDGAGSLPNNSALALDGSVGEKGVD